MGRQAVLCVLIVMAALGLCSAENPPSGAVMVLDTHSFWRCHQAFRPMLCGTASAPKPAPVPLRQVWYASDDGTGDQVKTGTLPAGQPRSCAPSDDWPAPAFRDEAWWRSPGPFYAGDGEYQPTGLAELRLRGKFRVSDPASVKALTFSAALRGGLVVFLNGKELGRSEMSESPAGPDALARDYPQEVFVGGKGRRMPKDALVKLLASRVRRVENMARPRACRQSPSGPRRSDASDHVGF